MRLPKIHSLPQGKTPALIPVFQSKHKSLLLTTPAHLRLTLDPWNWPTSKPSQTCTWHPFAQTALQLLRLCISLGDFSHLCQLCPWLQNLSFSNFTCCQVWSCTWLQAFASALLWSALVGWTFSFSSLFGSPCPWRSGGGVWAVLVYQYSWAWPQGWLDLTEELTFLSGSVLIGLQGRAGSTRQVLFSFSYSAWSSLEKLQSPRESTLTTAAPLVQEHTSVN